MTQMLGFLVPFSIGPLIGIIIGVKVILCTESVCLLAVGRSACPLPDHAVQHPHPACCHWLCGQSRCSVCAGFHRCTMLIRC